MVDVSAAHAVPTHVPTARDEYGQAGDLRAFEELMRLYNRRLYRTARAILRDDAEAENAVQEAYLQAYKALPSFRGEAKLSTWLVRITANEALMRRRRKSRAAPLEVDPDILPADTRGPEDDAQRGELRNLLEARIDALPEQYRAVFLLRGVEELTVEETSAALGIPEATVRTRFFRARSLLRATMGDIATTFGQAFAFAGQRCDRIVTRVFARIRQARSG